MCSIHQPEIINAMLERYPHLDYLMAETILNMHERGRLDAVLKEWEKPNDSKLVSFPTVRVENLDSS